MEITQLKITKKVVENNENINQSQNSTAYKENNTFLLRLLEYIDNDEFSRKFFQDISNYIKSVNNNNRLNLCNEIQTFCEEFNNLIIETKKQRDILKNIVQITEEECVSLKAAPFRNSKEGQGIGGIGFYSWTNFEKFGITFNGIKLTNEMIDSGENPYQSEYEKWQSEATNAKNEISQLEKALSYLKGKKTFFKRKEQQKQIKLIEERIAQLNSKLGDDSRINTLKDRYNSFTEEEKNGIKAYLNLVGKCEEYSKILLEKIDILCNYGYELKIEDTAIMKDLINKFLSQGLITQNEITDIISKLNSININGLNRNSDDPYKYSKVVKSFYNTFIGDIEIKNEEINKNVGGLNE